MTIYPEPAKPDAEPRESSADWVLVLLGGYRFPDSSSVGASAIFALEYFAFN